MIIISSLGKTDICYGKIKLIYYLHYNSSATSAMNYQSTSQTFRYHLRIIDDSPFEIFSGLTI